jgi:3-oxoacyl-[acyl-carrier-protein] synthase-1
LPPHWWDGAADESFPELALTQTGQSIAAQADICMMSSSFAFGGNNVALIMGSDFG